MSKVDGTRAIREARNAAYRAAKGGPPAAPTTAVPAATAPAKARAKDVPAEEPVAAELCGHRSMNGRSCRRPAGHAEKSHRYS